MYHSKRPPHSSNFSQHSPHNRQKIAKTGLELLIFGLIYNQMVGKLEETNDIHTPFLVIVGVAATIILAIPFIGSQSALSLFYAFAVTGTPMTLGYLTRWAKRKSNGRQTIDSQTSTRPQ